MSTTEAGPSGTSEHREGMLPVVESIDVSQREDLHKLRGRSVGLMGVLFLTVTGAAPISAMLFNTPIAVGFGNGIGAPAGFLVATIVLTVFSVGYVAMSRKVTAAGGFYSFISHGLNRELGMASGFAMVAAYSVFEVSLVGGFAYFASLKAAHYGWHVQWYWCGLFMIALICVLAYLDVPTLGQPEAFIHAKKGLFDAEGNIGEGSKKFLQNWMDQYVAWVKKHVG